MPELARLQETFAAALANAEQAPRAAALLHGAPGDVTKRLAVYRGNMVAAARKALSNAYPVIAKIVGGEFFEGLAREYLRRHPPVSGDLNAYGGELAAFVTGFSHTRDLPYLADMARMEWLAHRAWYAADARPLDAQELASIPESAWSGLRPVLAPACALLESRWPLAHLWEVHQDDYAGEFAVDPDSGPDRILIHRPRFRVAVTSLTTGACRFLQRVAGNDTIAAALQAALAEEPAFDFPAALRTWIAAGVIIGFASPTVAVT